MKILFHCFNGKQKNLKVLFCLVALFFLTGCCAIGTLKLYEGPEKPGDEIAIITIKERVGMRMIYADGKKIYVQAHRTLGSRYSSIAVEPGEHLLGAYLMSGYSYPIGGYPIYGTGIHIDTTDPYLLKVNVEKEHTYELKYESVYGNKGLYFHIWVEDTKTGEKVSQDTPLLKK